MPLAAFCSAACLARPSSPAFLAASTVAAASSGVVAAVCVAAGHAAKLWKLRQAPSKELRHELDDIHAALAKHDKLLANDKEALSTLQTEGILSLKAILALLDHSIDGNNISRMESVKDEIKDYLISRH